MHDVSTRYLKILIHKWCIKFHNISKRPKNPSKNFYNKAYCNKYSHKSAVTKVLKYSLLVFVLGVNTDCTGLIIWFLSMSRSLAQKTVCTFPPLPKTITPPNAAPTDQLQSNRSSAFEVFMDINDPTFQKSSTCLASRGIWARGEGLFQWKNLNSPTSH